MALKLLQTGPPEQETADTPPAGVLVWGLPEMTGLQVLLLDLAWAGQQERSGPQRWVWVLPGGRVAGPDRAAEGKSSNHSSENARADVAGILCIAASVPDHSGRNSYNRDPVEIRSFGIAESVSCFAYEQVFFFTLFVDTDLAA